ncbi:MFS transporter [Streptomyces sp. SCSIO ZS0520]|uniref:MFS transporter n=1 Tax=Streptomyces sp. SCSIO ZS0520 TaxID=2892996 RepID=UPI0021DADAD8|nr:MFS transporter [Streptomyces sp. SCSIO ZS0520]
MTEKTSTARPALTLLTVSIATILLPMSLTGASVAMPGASEDFHNGLAAGQWIVNGYDLTFASFMLAAGSFADRFGRRRLFALGSAVFAVCSLVSAVSNGIVMLDICRALAGVGAAAVITAGSAILAHTFEGAARARAFGVFGTAVGAGLAFGPFAAGALQTSFGWRAIFLVPAIVGAVVVALSLFLAESSDPDAVRVDWLGTVTFTGSLAFLILALLQGPQTGWADPVNLVSYVLAAALLVAFVMVELRQERPMFDLSLFRQPQFVSLCVAVVSLVFGFTPLLVYLPSYLTAVNAESTFHAGVDLLMLTVPTLVFPLVTGYLLRWVPLRHMVSLAVALTAIGCGWLVVLEPGAGNWTVLGPFLIIGTGVGISFGVMDGAAVSSVDSARAGMAAGMFNTMRLAGEAIAIAVVGSLLVSATRSELDGKLGGFDGTYANDPGGLADKLNQGQLEGPAGTVSAASRAAFTEVAKAGYTGALHQVLWFLAAFCAVATVLVAFVGARSQKKSAAEESAEPTAEAAAEAAARESQPSAV